MIRKILTYTLASILFASFGAYLYFADRLSRVEKEAIVCNEIRVEIADSASYALIKGKDIERFILNEYSNVIGMNISEINCNDIEILLKNKGVIRNCEVHIDRSGTLSVWASQYTPALRLCTQNGTFYCDANGYIFPSEDGRPPYMLTVTGHIPIECPKAYRGYIQDESQRQWLGNMLILNEAIRACADWNRMVSQIDIAPNAEMTILFTNTDIYVEFGGFEEWESKLVKMKEAFTSVIPSVEKESEILCISLKYSGQIVCRKKDKNKKQQ